MPKMTAANPLDRRVQATAEKLRAALDRLARSSVGSPMIERQLTVAALARRRALDVMPSTPITAISSTS